MNTNSNSVESWSDSRRVVEPRPLAFGALYGARVDAFVLGGASVFALVILEVARISSDQMKILAAAMFVLANFVNHPHFAHSYQIFYGLRKGLKDREISRAFVRRWWWAALIAPVLIVLLLGFSIWRWAIGDGIWLAISINVMGALVGWHYVKQGFGMLMLDATLKRRFWSPYTRRVLLWNAYICWIFAWLMINSLSSAGVAFWGVFGLAIWIPSWVLVFGCGALFASTVWSLLSVIRNVALWRRDMNPWGALPLNGVLAYVVTLYFWTAFSWVNSAFLLVIPFFHSLQYLAVVYRYKSNKSAKLYGNKGMTVVKFALTGIFVGAAGFWLIPIPIDYVHSGGIPFQTKGALVGVATAWIFINIHHYIIDNVLWRKESKEINFHLFSHLRS